MILCMPNLLQGELAMSKKDLNYRDFIRECECVACVQTQHCPCLCRPVPFPCCCISPTGPQGPAGPQGPMGPQGPAGEAGRRGETGSDGKSAYQIALDNGFAGSEAEWISSLKGEAGPSGPFLSSYMEALGNGQTIAANASIVFDPESLDSVGNNIVLDPSGTIFTIKRAGLYHVEWNINLATGTTSAVVGIIENGEAASGAASSSSGVLSSGTLVHVDTVPFTISLHNYEGEIKIENPVQWVDSAASIRIVRFADGPSE